MKFSTTAALIAATNASGADISGHLVAADTHFWTNAASITDSADSILNSVSQKAPFININGSVVERKVRQGYG